MNRVLTYYNNVLQLLTVQTRHRICLYKMTQVHLSTANVYIIKTNTLTHSQYNDSDIVNE